MLKDKIIFPWLCAGHFLPHLTITVRMGQFAKVTNIKPQLTTRSSWSVIHNGFSQLGTVFSMWEIGITDSLSWGE